MSAVRLLCDALADAESEIAELQRAKDEITKLRRVMVKHLCDCRRFNPILPLEPREHRLTCTYRREMQ